VARGWESKAVEAQQEQSIGDRARPEHAPVTRDELERRSKRATLALARARAAADLQHARSPAHRAMLQRALDSLDRQLEE
jgi:hypothetical protein